VHCHWEDKPLPHKLFFIVQMRQSFKLFASLKKSKIRRMEGWIVGKSAFFSSHQKVHIKQQHVLYGKVLRCRS
jgi:hypothetical protein